MRWNKISRHVGYALLTLPSALASMLLLPLAVVGLLSVAVGGLGLPLVPRMALALRWWTEAHRRSAAQERDETVTARPAALPTGLRAQWRWLLDDPGLRRDLRWIPRFVGTGLLLGLFGLLCAGGLLGTVAVVAGWPLLPDDERTMLGVPVDHWLAALGLGLAQFALLALLTWGVLPGFARWQARDTLAALEPSAEERLAERVGELTETRADVLDAHGAELRRIERDLHDGTQARLVSIAMRLGVARDELPDDTGALATLLREAQEGTEEAMTELRGVIRSMYPPILADRGLAGALTSMVAGSAVPTELDLTGLRDEGPDRRLPAAVEAAAYFVVTETLTNVAKHSGAGQARVTLARSGPRLTVEVWDDGRGGVDESLGSGVIGIRRRVAALDGTVTVTSPTGGPTVVGAELPCGS
ncbi:sensor histidine kinase [Streptomyces profundus]|uniref:sensor histidine kinase n=1 Tax=Streptomyces profundus TaxID=2867410 RepID=UPI001D166FF1|nr:histidine kinase [Streptomyces sp. MA3_2.13]